MSDETQPVQGTEPQEPAGDRTVLNVRDKGENLAYANVFLVSRGPEEVVLSFGTNFQPRTKEGQLNVNISDHVVVTYRTAKRLALTISQLVQRYESEHGVIEMGPRREVEEGQRSE